jgi:hypothetical protein
LVYAVSPYWRIDLTLAKHVTTEDVLINVLREPPFIANLLNLIGNDNRRLILSPDFQKTVDTHALMTRGLSTNSLPYDNLRVVNGIFKGISYAAFCPDASKLYGTINARDPDCNLANQTFLNIAGVKYALKYTDEKSLDGFHLVSILGVDRKERPIGLYVNPQAWDDAVFVDEKVFSLYPCPTGEGCGPDMFNTDFSAAAALRQTNHQPISSVDKPGEILLNLQPENEVTNVMVDEYYLSDWKAYARGIYGQKEIPVEPILKHFIGLKIPAGTAAVRLVYRPEMRILLEIISFSSLLMLCACLAWGLVAGWRINRKNRGRITG